MIPDLILHDSMHKVRVRWISENIVRLTRIPSSAATFPPDLPWYRQVFIGTSESLAVKSMCDAWNLPLKAELVSGFLRLIDLQGEEVFREAIHSELKTRGKIQIKIQTRLGEGFYGWGEWFNAFRRERGSFHLKNVNATSGMQNKQTYASFPFFISSRGYGFFLLDSRKTKWVIDPDRHQIEITSPCEVDEKPVTDYLVIYGPGIKDIIRNYTQLTGRPPLLPRWAFGLWMTSYPQGHQDGVVEYVRQHRERKIPLDVVILDYHWEEKFHNFRWCSELIPEPDRLISELKALGMRLGLILTPFLDHNNLYLVKIALQAMLRDIPRGMVFRDDRALPEFREARDAGLLAHVNAFWWFGRGGMMDFTNPEAASWWHERLKPLYHQGVDFFKNDDGEYLPEDSDSDLGLDGREYQNLYGFYYGRAMYEEMEKLDDRRALIYARSTWAGSQRYPALFLGDQQPTFDCLRRTICAGLNLSLAGFSYWTADVFGLDGKTSLETHMRYAQWALMVPVARYFWRPPEIDATRFPWSHGQQAEANFKLYTDLRYRLLPYYYALAWEAWQTGIPILRPLLIEYPDDPRLANCYDQVMLGETMMFAPVVQKGALSRRILLPAGTWHDFWSSQTWQGPGEMDYPAPLDRLPILIRGSSILPMGGVLSHIPDDHRFDPLQLHIYPPYPARGVIYEDDGCTRAYQRGEYALTRVTVVDEPSALLIRITAVEGHFSGQVEKRQVGLILHRITKPDSIRVDNRGVDDWEYDAETQCIILRLTQFFENPLEITVMR